MDRYELKHNGSGCACEFWVRDEDHPEDSIPMSMGEVLEMLNEHTALQARVRELEEVVETVRKRMKRHDAGKYADVLYALTNQALKGGA